jgi:hypothetical protein
VPAALDHEPAPRERRDVIDVSLEHRRERSPLSPPEAVEQITVIRKDRHSGCGVAGTAETSNGNGISRLHLRKARSADIWLGA